MDRTVDEFIEARKKDAAREAAKKQAQEAKAKKQYARRLDALRPYALEALNSETGVSLVDLDEMLGGLEFSDQAVLKEKKFSMAGTGPEMTVTIVTSFKGWLLWHELPITARFTLDREKHKEGIITYNRDGSYFTCGRHFQWLDDALIYAQERAEEAERNQKASDDWQAEQDAEQKAKRQAVEDERDALLSDLENNPVAINLLRTFLVAQRQIEAFEDAIFTLEEGWDRCAANSAQTVGDLQAELDSTKADLSRERDRANRAEDDYAREKRRRIGGWL